MTERMGGEPAPIPERLGDDHAAAMRVTNADAATGAGIALDQVESDKLVDILLRAPSRNRRAHRPRDLAIAGRRAAALDPLHDVRQGLDAPGHNASIKAMAHCNLFASTLVYNTSRESFVVKLFAIGET